MAIFLALCTCTTWEPSQSEWCVRELESMSVLIAMEVWMRMWGRGFYETTGVSCV